MVPKKGGFTVIRNEKNELIPTRIATGWRVCIDYRKLNIATKKDHYPLPFLLVPKKCCFIPLTLYVLSTFCVVIGLIGPISTLST